jgi:amino acid adenylation domain-containing protein
MLFDSEANRPGGSEIGAAARESSTARACVMAAESGTPAPNGRLRTAPERHTASAPPPCTEVVELFDRQAAAHPDATAVQAGADRLTYRELARRADALAERLRAGGAGSPVGVCLPRGVDAVVAMVAAVRAGLGYLPLDPAHPPVRLGRMLVDAGADTVLAEPDTGRRLREATDGGVRALPVSGPRPDPAGPAGPDRATGAGSPGGDGLAYVIYTSGSTGRPKAVAVGQDSLANLLLDATERIGATAQDAWTCAHSFAFDLSVWEIWAPLVTGGRLVLVPSSAQRSMAELDRLLRETRVTVLNLTPSVLRELVRWRRGRGDHGALRTVISGGEPLPVDLAGETCGWPVRLWNFYGPTEATVWAAIGRVGPDDLADPVVAIGSPLAHTSLQVRDDRLRPVPDGLPGELCIGGRAVARGYVGQPELTGRRFVPDPAGGPGERLYRTGDLVTRRPDGRLSFLGRADHQIKLRGFRVEPGEVEATLRRSPDVRDVVVLAREVGGTPTLVAYVVPSTGANVDPRGLRERAGRELPAHMVPAVVIQLPELPLNANGKVDRAALPEHPPVPAGPPADPPRGHQERRIARWWAHVLAAPEPAGEPARDDDFFAVGGNSLLAMRLSLEVSRECGVTLPLERLFQVPTIAGMATAVEAALGGEAADSVSSTDELEKDVHLDLSIVPGEPR